MVTICWWWIPVSTQVLTLDYFVCLHIYLSLAAVCSLADTPCTNQVSQVVVVGAVVRQLILSPCFIFQYRIGQLYMISKHSHEQSDRGEGVEVVQNEPFEDPTHGQGQFTEKRVYLNRSVGDVSESLLSRTWSHILYCLWAPLPLYSQLIWHHLYWASIVFTLKFDVFLGQNPPTHRTCCVFKNNRGGGKKENISRYGYIFYEEYDAQKLKIKFTHTGWLKTISGVIFTTLNVCLW